MMTDRKLRLVITQAMTDTFGFSYEEEIQETVDRIMEKVHDGDDEDEDLDDTGRPPRYLDDDDLED